MQHPLIFLVALLYSLDDHISGSVGGCFGYGLTLGHQGFFSFPEGFDLIAEFVEKYLAAGFTDKIGHIVHSLGIADFTPEVNLDFGDHTWNGHLHDLP